MFADYGNPNTEFSYTQDWIEEALMYGVYENSWRSCRQTWPEKMVALVEKRLCVKQKFQFLVIFLKENNFLTSFLMLSFNST